MNQCEMQPNRMIQTYPDQNYCISHKNAAQPNQLGWETPNLNLYTYLTWNKAPKESKRNQKQWYKNGIDLGNNLSN